MKTIVVAVLAFGAGVACTYIYAMYSFVSMAQITTQAKVQSEAALVEFLDLGKHDHVTELLLLSLCANRDYLKEQSNSLFWQDKEMSDRVIKSTSEHCVSAT